MIFFGPLKTVGTLLDQGTQTVVHAGTTAFHVGTGVVHEVTAVTHPLVHAVEQPLSNMYRDTRMVVSGTRRVVRGLTHLLPYGLSAWLLWSFVTSYLPEEGQAVMDVVDRAAKRMRLR